MSIKVIVVDDDDVVVFLHRKMIEISNFKSDPICFLSGKEAFDFLIKDFNPGNSYLIFLDINMPLMNSWEFLELVDQEKFKDSVYVVIVTSSINESDKVKANDYKRVIAFLEKPVNLEKLKFVKEQEVLKGFNLI